jgi:hypothetical protein
MNNIITNQNTPEVLKLLRAQRVAYSNAKRYELFDVVSIIIAVLPPILIIFGIVISEILTIIAVIWTIISIYSEIYRKSQTILGAKIQEQFDITLFKIPWNSIFVGSKIELSTIIQTGNKYKKDDLTNWYSTYITASLPQKVAVLLCYKCNTVWGKLQRGKFIFWLSFSLIVYYGAMLLISICNNKGLYDIIIWIAPSLSFLVYISASIKNHKEILINYEQINFVVDSLIEGFKNNKKEPDVSELRQIQDYFYSIRIIPYKIPDWFYYIKKKTSNNVTDETIKTIVNEITVHNSTYAQ